MTSCSSVAACPTARLSGGRSPAARWELDGPAVEAAAPGGERMFAILYEEASEQDLADLRRFDQRRVLDEVDTQQRANPMTPTRRKKILVGILPPGTRFALCGNCA